MFYYYGLLVLYTGKTLLANIVTLDGRQTIRHCECQIVVREGAVRSTSVLLIFQDHIPNHVLTNHLVHIVVPLLAAIQITAI